MPPVEVAVLGVIAVPRVALIVELLYEKFGDGTGGAELLQVTVAVSSPPLVSFLGKVIKLFN